MRVREHFLQQEAPPGSGRILQMFTVSQESFAVGTLVVHLPQSVHTEREDPTGEPDEDPSFIGQLSHNHLDWAVEKGDRLRVNHLHSNCTGTGDWPWLGVVHRWIHVLPISPHISPLASPSWGAAGMEK